MTARAKGERTMAIDFSRWSLARWFRTRARGSEPVTERPVNPYHAVSIVAGTTACPAARALGETRFLSREAPRLPLAVCDAERCSCRYRHHDDRRRRVRRRGDDEGSSLSWPGPERRHGRGRRASDHSGVGT